MQQRSASSILIIVRQKESATSLAGAFEYGGHVPIRPRVAVSYGGDWDWQTGNMAKGALIGNCLHLDRMGTVFREGREINCHVKNCGKDGCHEQTKTKPGARPGWV